MDYEKNTIPFIIKESSSLLLIGLLKQINGPKDLIISPKLIASMDIISGFSTLKVYFNVHIVNVKTYILYMKAIGVEKIYKLNPGSPPEQNNRTCCYLIYSSVEDTKCVTDHINAERISGRSNLNFWIIFVPKMSRVCDKILEEEGVYGFVNVLEYPLTLIPLDTDLFSLELNDCFSRLFLNSDYTYLSTIATSLTNLNTLVGSPLLYYSQGKYSKMVLNIMKASNDKKSTKRSPIDCVLLIDRDVDYPSVLLSQLNYEGLLDETFGISCGKVTLPHEVEKTCGLTSPKYPVNSNDPLYRDIRGCHLSAAFALLKERSIMFKNKHAERQEMDLNAMKDFVSNELKAIKAQHKSLNLHVSSCEAIMDIKKSCDFSDQLKAERNLTEVQSFKESINTIEEIIIRQFSFETSLRMLCLLSITQDGLTFRDYKHLITLFLQSYGHEHIITLFNLKKLGLLMEQNPSNAMGMLGSQTGAILSNKVAAAMSAFPKRSQFRTISRRLNLVPPAKEEGYDVRKPQDPAFVYGGTYIPVICQLVEMLILNKNPNNDELLKLLPGESFYWKRERAGKSDSQDVSPKVVLVYFVGGVTFAEVTALRFFGSQRNLSIIIGTTSIINGNQLMKQISPVS